MGWLTDIGVEMAGQGAEPGLERVQRFRDAGEIAPLHDLLGGLELGLGREDILVPNGNRGGDVSRARHIGAEVPAAPSSASAALLAASLSIRVEASLVITSLRIAATDFCAWRTTGGGYG